MKLGLISLGCPKNLVDSEVMLGIIEKYNIEITNDPEAAEVIIVNTCGFIESAKQESIETILSMAAYTKVWLVEEVLDQLQAASETSITGKANSSLVPTLCPGALLMSHSQLLRAH